MGNTRGFKVKWLWMRPLVKIELEKQLDYEEFDRWGSDYAARDLRRNLEAALKEEVRDHVKMKLVGVLDSLADEIIKNAPVKKMYEDELQSAMQDKLREMIRGNRNINTNGD